MTVSTPSPAETYKAFKARTRHEFDRQHGIRPHSIQQKILRVHLQHFLLTVGAEVSREQPQARADVISKEESIRAFLNEQKRLAVLREANRTKRQRAARRIQHFVRRKMIMETSAVCEGEAELSSTSVFIALETEKRATETSDARNCTLKVLETAPSSGVSRGDLPPYEVVIELVAARNLAMGSALSSKRYVDAELLLKGQAGEIARVVSERQPLLRVQDGNFEWQDTILRFGFDPHAHGITAQSVIDEWSVMITVKTVCSGGAASSLGIVEIPLSLLETPLATEYALCRWFPLARAFPGHTARGDLRAKVAYLMHPKAGDNVDGNMALVPYVNSETPKSYQYEKKTATGSAPLRKRAGMGFQRKQAIPATDSATNVSRTMQPPVLSLKDSLSSPIGRISRAEALSPPSSPSSVTSSETGEGTPATASPQSPYTMQADRRTLLPKRMQKYNKPTKIPPPKNDQVDEEEPDSPRSPAKPIRTFLKRKPYKVVFQKLDWSGVSAKTDSNLSTSNTRANIVQEYQASRTSRPSSQAAESVIELGSNSTGNAGLNSDFTNGMPPGGFMDEVTSQRLAAVETAVYKRCCVTHETASLARFKYQTERKQFEVTLQQQKESCVNDTDELPSNTRSESVVPGSTVTELWKKLTGDSSGQLYSSMLRNYTNRHGSKVDPE